MENNKPPTFIDWLNKYFENPKAVTEVYWTPKKGWGNKKKMTETELKAHWKRAYNIDGNQTQ